GFGLGASGGAGGQAKGGGFYSLNSALTLIGNTLSSNQAIGGNGGVGGSVRFLMHKAGNGGAGGSAQGGGFYHANGLLTLPNDTRSGVQATGGGGGFGGISNKSNGGDGGDGGDAQGGGFYASGDTIAITQSTITQSIVTAGRGGGGFKGGSRGSGGNGGNGGD